MLKSLEKRIELHFNLCELYYRCIINNTLVYFLCLCFMVFPPACAVFCVKFVDPLKCFRVQKMQSFSCNKLPLLGYAICCFLIWLHLLAKHL